MNGWLSQGLEYDDLLEALMEFDAMSKEEINQIRSNNRELFKSRYSLQVCAANYEKLFSRFT